MARSILLQLARDSIVEVIEAKRTINKPLLLDEHPLLNEPINSEVNIYLDKKLRGSYKSSHAMKSLLEDIIFNAKKAAFEDTRFAPITTSEYLSCEVEVVLYTQEGVMSEKDPAIL
jgi:hypothetical protein